jgi:hypothetical protein
MRKGSRVLGGFFGLTRVMYVYALFAFLEHGTCADRRMEMQSQQAIHQTFEAQLEEGKGSVSTFAFPFETKEHGVVKHVCSLFFFSPL